MSTMTAAELERSVENLRGILASLMADLDRLKADMALTRDLVKLRRQAREGADVALDIAAHEIALTLASTKLAAANLAYYETRDAMEQQPRMEPHSH